MISENRSSNTGKKWPTSAALMLTGALLLTIALALPLHAQEANNSAQTIPPDVAKQIEALTKRVEQLEQQLKEHEAAGQPTTVVQTAKAQHRCNRLVAPAQSLPLVCINSALARARSRQNQKRSRLSPIGTGPG